MAVVLPYALKDGTLADAVQVMANFTALAEAIEGVTAAAVGTDVYQSGVVASTDWMPGAGSINGGTGVLQFTTFGGAAWLPGPVSGLVRTFTTSATVGGLKPPVLPGPAGYVNVGVELTASGAEATVSVVSGAEQVSEALALANPAAVSSGKARVRDVIVKNTAGVYSIVKERDRRPWARGARAMLKRTSGSITLPEAAEPLDGTGLALRIECSGAPVVLALHTFAATTEQTAAALVGFRMDGAAVDGTTDGGLTVFTAKGTGAGSDGMVDVVYSFVPPAGSHLFQPTGKSPGKLAQLASSAGTPLLFSVCEDLRPSANNGTA